MKPQEHSSNMDTEGAKLSDNPVFREIIRISRAQIATSTTVSLEEMKRRVLQ
jgi:hypothetical protein